MRVLISGSSGFVGRHFRAYFTASKSNLVTCVDITRDCRTLFRDEDEHYDLVVHCAAVVGGRQTIDGEPLRLAAEDLSIDAALFAWALRTRPGRIVYFSSAAAYATHHQALASPGVLLDETDHMMGTPDQSYGHVKRMGEYLARLANDVGIRTHVFRPFSGYGGDQGSEYPFPAIVTRAARGDDPLTVWSNSIRDFVHIDDIVGCVLAAIHNNVLGPVNICTGRAVSFVELARMVAVQAGYDPEIVVEADKPTGVHRRVGDPTRMRAFYTPKIPLEVGIHRALNTMVSA